MEALQDRNIRWGIIGLGHIANIFAQDLLTVDGAELYAVASRTQAKADQFAEEYQATQAYASYQALVNDPNIDAVYIATPHALHQENTQLCLRKGIAVLCEKPLAMNLDEVDAMIATAKENDVLLMEALWTYFLPHYQFVLRELKNKSYGELIKVEADFGFAGHFDEKSRLFKKSLGGGSLLDLGIYPIFVALSTLGIPTSASAHATFFANGADASCIMQFNYANGATAALRSSLIEDTPTEAIFYCERGTIKINHNFHAPATVTLITNGDEKTLDFNYTTIGYSYEIAHFNELLRHHRLESDIMTFAFSRNLITTLDRVRELIALQY